MPRLLTVVLLLCLSGCLGIYRAIAGEENPDVVEIRALAIGRLGKGCRPEQLKIEERDWRREMQWSATGCAVPLSCLQIEGKMRCFDAPPRIADWGEKWLPQGFELASRLVAGTSGCQASEARLTTIDPPQRNEMGLYAATLCGRSFRCKLSMNRHGDFDVGESNCNEVAAQGADLDAAVIGRLEVETGCPAGRIAIVSRTSGGTEQAFRMTACDQAYVCTSNGGHTDCRPAAVQQPQQP